MVVESLIDISKGKKRQEELEEMKGGWDTRLAKP